MEKCAFIYNPNSGNGSILKYKDYIYNLLKNKYEVILEETKFPHHASEIIKELKNNISIVVSGGGDGTFNEVITANLNRAKQGKNQFILSHIPCGTANDFRNTFYNTKDIKKIVESILNGKEINLDIFSINENYFYYVAALGIIANASFSTPTELKRYLGYFSYIFQTIKELFNSNVSFDLTYKNNEIIVKDKFSLIVASNSNSIGGLKLKALSDAEFSDGRFEFKALKYINRLQMIIDIIRIITGVEKLEKIKNLQSIKTSFMSIKFEELPNISWSIDGEKKENIGKEIIIKKEGESRILVPNYTYKRLSI